MDSIRKLSDKTTLHFNYSLVGKVVCVSVRHTDNGITNFYETAYAKKEIPCELSVENFYKILSNQETKFQISFTAHPKIHLGVSYVGNISFDFDLRISFVDVQFAKSENNQNVTSTQSLNADSGKDVAKTVNAIEAVPVNSPTFSVVRRLRDLTETVKMQVTHYERDKFVEIVTFIKENGQLYETFKKCYKQFPNGLSSNEFFNILLKPKVTLKYNDFSDFVQIDAIDTISNFDSRDNFTVTLDKITIDNDLKKPTVTLDKIPSKDYKIMLQQLQNDSTHDEMPERMQQIDRMEIHQQLHDFARAYNVVLSQQFTVNSDYWHMKYELETHRKSTKTYLIDFGVLGSILNEIFKECVYTQEVLPYECEDAQQVFETFKQINPLFTLENMKDTFGKSIHFKQLISFNMNELVASRIIISKLECGLKNIVEAQFTK